MEPGSEDKRGGQRVGGDWHFVLALRTGRPAYCSEQEHCVIGLAFQWQVAVRL